MNKSLKRRSRKAPKKNKSRSKRPRSKRPRSKRPRSKRSRSRFGEAEERERKIKEIADKAKSMNITSANYLRQRERDFHNHLLVPTPPTRLDRALELSRNSGQKYSSNPERFTQFYDKITKRYNRTYTKFTKQIKTN